MKPEEATEAARRAAAAGRAQGTYPAAAPPRPVAQARPDLAKLREWALIEVDADLLYSTRRGGRPITWAKRMLLRLLRQYTIELEAQQTRFNTGVVAYLESLDKQDGA
jgi:hypothetical protein